MATNDAATIGVGGLLIQRPISVCRWHQSPGGVDIDQRNGGYHDHWSRSRPSTAAGFFPVLSLVVGAGIATQRAERCIFPRQTGAGIDLKHNGYLIVEPSNHSSGRLIRIWASSSILDEAPSPLPDWVKDLGRAQHVATPSIVRQFANSEIAEVKRALAVINAMIAMHGCKIGMAYITVSAQSASTCGTMETICQM